MPRHRSKRLIERFDDGDALAAAAAEAVAAAARAAVAARGSFALALSGGSTPRPTYERLGGMPELPWTRTTVLFADERCVDPADERSNFRLVREALLDRLPEGRRPRVLRMEGEWVTRDAAAEEYEERLRAAVPGNPPVLDLALLGIGEDGHTASLFPGSPLLGAEEGRLVAAARHPETGEWRLTLTPAVLRAARERLFLVAGAGKSAAVAEALRAGSPLPAAQVGPARWFLAPGDAFPQPLQPIPGPDPGPER